MSNNEEFSDLDFMDERFEGDDEEEIPEKKVDTDENRELIADAVAQNPSMTALEIAFDLHLPEPEVRTMMYQKETITIIKKKKFDFSEELRDAKEISINFLKRVVENKHERYTVSDRINVAKFLSKNIVENSDADGTEEIHFITEISKAGAVSKKIKKYTKQDLIDV